MSLCVGLNDYEQTQARIRLTIVSGPISASSSSTSTSPWRMREASAATGCVSLSTRRQSAKGNEPFSSRAARSRTKALHSLSGSSPSGTRTTRHAGAALATRQRGRPHAVAVRPLLQSWRLSVGVMAVRESTAIKWIGTSAEHLRRRAPMSRQR